jgi:SnoaL-like domain
MSETLGTHASTVKQFLTEVRSPDNFAAFFAEGATYRFGNFPPIHGRSAIRESSIGFRSRVKSAKHDIKNLWEIGDTVVSEMEVIYTRHDDKVVVVPCTDVIRFQDELFQEMRIYIDMSPVFAP